MAFFNRKERQLANKSSFGYLRHGYERTENDLSKACLTGEIANVKKVMKEHKTFEYALLYKQLNKK